MVSLLKLANITEEGVRFSSPHDGSEMLLTPEESMRLQNSIGADIMMQLDDVANPLSSEERLLEAMERSVRWLDRCKNEHKRPSDQALFAIVQGGLDLARRQRCLEEMVARDAPGYAIGGLGGGEDKESFCRMVLYCTQRLPPSKPIYCMGIGYDVDLVVCVALGVDMFDCVFPTRTARFGHALHPSGQLSLKQTKYARDFAPIDESCACITCTNYSRAYLHAILNTETVACHYLSIHNIAYQLNLMKTMRASILTDSFPDFVKTFFHTRYKDNDIPTWILNALRSVNIII